MSNPVIHNIYVVLVTHTDYIPSLLQRGLSIAGSSMYFATLSTLLDFHSTRPVDSMPQLVFSDGDLLTVRGMHTEQPWYALDVNYLYYVLLLT